MMILGNNQRQVPTPVWIVEINNSISRVASLLSHMIEIIHGYPMIVVRISNYWSGGGFEPNGAPKVKVWRAELRSV